MISRIETFHSKTFIHRDCKPENFLIGTGKKSHTLFMIDFGLSKRYRCPKTGDHVENAQRNMFAGTVRYSSYNA